MKALILDFDGVLANSAPECFEVALRTYAVLEPQTTLERRDPGSLRAGFVALMPLGNRAEDFGVALAALEENREFADQAAYDAYRDARPAGWLDAFHRRFYEQRNALAAAEPERWLALNAPYGEFLALLRRRAGEVALAIATAKDRAAVRRLLLSWGVSDLFPDALLVDKETGKSKVLHLQQLQSALALPYADLTFVDDKVNHLEEVSPLGVRCGLAAWGYNGPRERGIARERGFLVCGLEDAEALLFAGVQEPRLVGAVQSE